MRTLFCLLLCSSASAAPLVLDYGSQDRLFDNAIASPQRIAINFATFSIAPENGMTLQAQWVQTVTPADVGQTWTLNAASAAGLGVDWNLLRTGLAELAAHGWENNPWQLGFFTPDLPEFDRRGGNPPRNRYYLAPDPFFRSGLRPVIDLDRIDLTLEEFFSNPLGAILQFRPKVYGDGQYVPVPEPACWLLLLLGAWHLTGTSRSLLCRP